MRGSITLLMLWALPVAVEGQTIVIQDRAEDWAAAISETMVGLPPVMVDLSGVMPGGGAFNLEGEFRALLRSQGLPIVAPGDLQVGAESVVVQCMASVGETRDGETSFAYYERVYHWDPRLQTMNPVWEAFGLATSSDPPEQRTLFVCTHDVEQVLRDLGYGRS